MTRLFGLLLLLVPLEVAGFELAPAPQHLLAGLDRASAERIGQRIFRNEAAGRREWLVHWLKGEDHLSLGIGHFIWYPPGRRGPFRESFPEFLAFLASRHVPLPVGLTPGTAAPWPDRAAFMAAADGPAVEELRDFMIRTMPHQTAFMADRLAQAMPVMLEAAPAGQRMHVRRQIETLLFEPDGRFRPEGAYPLIDYVNFKGDGTDPAERYQGVGWGLLQVLSDMAPGHPAPRSAFAEAAERVLRRRVALAPADRREERWLDGWLIRIATYRTFEIPGPVPVDQAARAS